MVTNPISFDPATRGWFENTNVKLATLPPLDGTLVIESQSCDSASTDFGNIVAARPSAVLNPGLTRDIAIVARFCQQHRIPLAMRGQGTLPTVRLW
jgi:cytokinin dehydrogenase